MNSYIDIHSHILPGIDDGAKNFDTSMEMLRIAWKDGIRGIIFTPHNKPGRRNAGAETLRGLVRKLESAAVQEGMDFSFYTGNEVFYRSGIPELLSEGSALPLADSSYILAEFDPMDSTDHIRKGVYQILSGGYLPVLAHVERYGSVVRKREQVEDLIEMGCYIQVNAGSIMGKYGFSAKQLVKGLLKERLVHFVATDAHDTEKRKPELSECAAYISRKYGEEYAVRLMFDNPMRVIADEYI